MCEYTKLLEKHKAANDDFSEKYFYWIPDDSQETRNLVKICDGGYVHKDNYDSFMELQHQIQREHKEYLLTHVYEVVYFQCWNYQMEENLSYTYHDFIFNILDFSSDEVRDYADEIERAIWDYQWEFYHDDC